MAPAHPDIRLLFPGKAPYAAAGGYPPTLAGIFGYPPLNGRQGTSSPAEKVSLPVGKVHLPCRLEGKPVGKVQWVDSEKWLLILDSRALKHKLEVMRLGQVVHHSSQKMNMK
jgi:hypothetical protein